LSSPISLPYHRCDRTRETRIILRNEQEWSTCDGCYCKGKAFLGDALKERAELAVLLAKDKIGEGLAGKMDSLNGFFSVILDLDDATFLAVDRVRSIPLFYSITNNKILVSDDALLILKEIGGGNASRLAASEFLCAGYVTGNETLIDAIKQVCPGEVVRLDKSNVQTDIHRHRYFVHRPSNGPDAGDESITSGLLDGLNDAVVSIFSRLKHLSRGRTIVVPLSGGYDSRLVVTALRGLDCDSVIAFSYGREGNKESGISRRVARELGYEWFFVPYSNDKWEKWGASSQFKSFLDSSHNLCSLPHIQDWPAIWELKEQGVIDGSSVLVPGLAGDFISGSNFPKPLLNQKSAITDRDILGYVVNRRFGLWGADRLLPATRADIERKLSASLRIGGTYSLPAACAIYESWEWGERQSKFLANSVRAYDFWGLDWWLPYWDKQFIEFSSSVPFELKRDRKLYKKYVNRRFHELTRKRIKTTHERRGLIHTIYSIQTKVPKTPITTLSDIIIGTYDLARRYDKHPLAWYGLVGEMEFRSKYTRREDINSFLSMKLLSSIEPDMKMTNFLNIDAAPRRDGSLPD
jgi:asparagine synthase (glutamine-hydrolysing)